jgi:hypothetical protein
LGNINNFICVLIFGVILVIYFFSGYISTTVKIHWYKYFGIAILGLLSWLIGYFTSPNSLDYKNDSEAGIWMIYRFYIAGIETPLNYMDKFSFAQNYSIQFEIYFIVVLPFLASFMQYLGGVTKTKKIL